MATVAATGAVVGGCSGGPVQVSAPPQAPRACAELKAALPAEVDGLARRDVEPAGAPAAAWGDPPVVLQCGVPKPPALRPSSPCAEVNHVGWFAQRRDDAYRFTTIGRSTYVRVDVPYEYQPAADGLVDLARAVRTSVPEVDPCV